MIKHDMDTEYAEARAALETAAAMHARLRTSETSTAYLRAIKYYGEVGLRRIGSPPPKWPKVGASPYSENDEG